MTPGDWFNKIDWTGQGTNWGIGLPIASQNQSQWPVCSRCWRIGFRTEAGEYCCDDGGVPGVSA